MIRAGSFLKTRSILLASARKKKALVLSSLYNILKDQISTESVSKSIAPHLPVSRFRKVITSVISSLFIWTKHTVAKLSLEIRFILYFKGRYDQAQSSQQEQRRPVKFRF